MKGFFIVKSCFSVWMALLHGFVQLLLECIIGNAGNRQTVVRLSLFDSFGGLVAVLSISAAFQIAQISQTLL